MLTYQDLLDVGENEADIAQFVATAIKSHKSGELYRQSKIADEYLRQQNRTIVQYQKLLYTMSGQAVPDNYSANHKLASNYFYRLVTQQVQYLLGNGIHWENEASAEKLGKDFDIRLQDLARIAIRDGVGFGFFNLDHLEVFSSLEFVPLYDEENGALMAGIRFWQIDPQKPLRATLYQIDGVTEYIYRDSKPSILKEKRPYKLNIGVSEADGIEIYSGENYPTFPIIPMWGNPLHQSELVGLREKIDAYDLIKSGFANDLDDASQIYWTIQNAGGMDDIDLVKFLEHMKTVKAAVVDQDGASAQAHTIDVPYASREALLERSEKDIYRDFMGVNTEQIAAGQVTATQIEAAYDPLNAKTDQFEYCVIDFLQEILKLAGVDDNPTFTRSLIKNVSEELEKLMLVAQVLPEEYLTKKVLLTLGDADKIDEVLDAKDRENVERMTGFTQRVVEDEEEA